MNLIQPVIGHSLLEIIVAASSRQQTADQRYQQTIFHFHNAVYSEDYGRMTLTQKFKFRVNIYINTIHLADKNSIALSRIASLPVMWASSAISIL